MILIVIYLKWRKANFPDHYSEDKPDLENDSVNEKIQLQNRTGEHLEDFWGSFKSYLKDILDDRSEDKRRRYHEREEKELKNTIKCKKCNKQYVGQTGNTLVERFYGHTTDKRNGNQYKPVFEHFTNNDHNMKDVTITGIKTTVANVRLRTEEAYIQFLNTQAPSVGA
ncbi:unnamed protein product [Mytilus coruscus]|uniref:GIY-YIG domain-containing protein n=1 Tax=Mytilus coruscus TaxID=42192 RepID=A0A6J7ZUL9_MYTCO|nr:unnamed protein product [Mytilus coruscus]